MGKVITNIETAFEHLEDGMTVLAGGFGLCGIPEYSIAAVSYTHLTLPTNREV